MKFLRATLATALLFGVTGVVAGLGLSGCNQNAGPAAGAGGVHGETTSQSQDAQIRAAIMTHLTQQSSLNVQSFDTDVKQVTIQGDHAHADVDFRVKNGAGVMQFTYELERHDGSWAVVGSNPVGGHQGATQ